MPQFLMAIVLGFTDLLLAAWHILTRRKRGLYATTTHINAPRASVWELLMRQDVTYQSTGLRSVQQPIPGRENVVIGQLSIKGRPVAQIGMAYLEVVPEDHLLVHYLPEHTDRQGLLGGHDHVVMSVSDLAGGGTRLGVTRELTHLQPGTRITVPMGLRSTAHMLKLQAELEAGVAPAQRPWWHHIAWALAAFASFAFIFGWRDAALLLAIIAVHEAGHALAMLHFGMGVRLISFIPFFGGIAVPLRAPVNEWQRGIVALMGVGFSLPLSLLVLWLAHASESPVAAEAVVMSAFINGFNLLPLPGLDGSVVVQMLLRKVHPLIARTVAWAMLAAFFAFAVAVNDPIIWITVAFSLLVLVQTMSVKFDERLQPMAWPGSIALLALLIALCAAYVAMGYAAIGLVGELT